MNKDTEIVPFSPYTFYLKDYLFSGWMRNGRLLRNVSRSISAARYARPWAACTPLSGQAAAYVWDGYGKLRGGGHMYCSMAGEMCIFISPFPSA